MSDWQPIETAPKDGSFFYGWVVCGGMGQAERMQWRDREFRFSDGGYVAHVSHWMPQPKAPEQSA